MTTSGNSLLDILEPPANQWLRNLVRSDTPLPRGIRVVRYADGDIDVFESGALFRQAVRKRDLDLSTEE